MVNVPAKVADRLSKGVVRFQKVLTAAKDRDVGESDTVTIVTDMLSSIFGFDRYEEITSEQAIRGTFCDLAVCVEGKCQYLIEVKAIGLSLKEGHLRQAVNYGAGHGIPWVVLTNGIQWDIHRIRFEQPVTSEHVTSINFLELVARRAADDLFLLCREGIQKDAMEAYHEHRQAVNRYVVAALLATDDVLAVVRREIRRLSPETKVTVEELRELLPDVVKRDAIEGSQAEQAQKRIRRAAGRALRKTDGGSLPPAAAPTTAQ